MLWKQNPTNLSQLASLFSCSNPFLKVDFPAFNTYNVLTGHCERRAHKTKLITPCSDPGYATLWMSECLGTSEINLILF